MRVLNAHKAARPDRFPRLESQVLSLDQATVSTCLKNTAIIPVPETIFNHVSEWLLPYCPIIMKCFERPVMAHIKSSTAALQFGQTAPQKMQFPQPPTDGSGTGKYRCDWQACTYFWQNRVHAGGETYFWSVMPVDLENPLFHSSVRQ